MGDSFIGIEGLFYKPRDYSLSAEREIFNESQHWVLSVQEDGCCAVAINVSTCSGFL